MYGEGNMRCEGKWKLGTDDRNDPQFSPDDFCFWRDSPPQWARASSFTRFPDHTQRRATVGRTTLDE